MLSRHRPGRLRTLVVLAALTVSVLAGTAPVHASPPDDTPASCIVEQVRGPHSEIETTGWKWLSSSCTDGGIGTQGWKWL